MRSGGAQGRVNIAGAGPKISGIFETLSYLNYIFQGTWHICFVLFF